MKISRILAVGSAWLLAACANVGLVPQGEAVVGEHLSLQLDRTWNRFESHVSRPVPTWTREGVSVDALEFFVTVKDGTPLAPTVGKTKAPAFRSTMQAHEIVSLFENFYTRDGSTFQLDRLTPESFADSPGFRFEFTRVRKDDDVRLSGVGWCAVKDKALTAMVFTAPRLHFFAQELPAVEHLARSARLR